jgi:hypothetical protein
LVKEVPIQLVGLQPQRALDRGHLGSIEEPGLILVKAMENLAILPHSELLGSHHLPEGGIDSRPCLQEFIW